MISQNRDEGVDLSQIDDIRNGVLVHPNIHLRLFKALAILKV